MKAAGTLLFAESTGRVLLLRRADGQGWDQPGGMTDDGDESPAVTAARELEEETRLTGALLDCLDSFVVRRLKDGRYVLYWPRPPELAALDYTVFVCTFREEFAPVLSDEHTDWGWFDRAAPPADIHPGTAMALLVCAEKGI